MNAHVGKAMIGAVIFLAASPLAAQQVAQTHPGIRSNSLYMEAGGNIGDLSVNYERLLGKATLIRMGFGNRLESYGDCFGIGFVSACEGDVDITLVGAMVSRLIGNRHMAELGFGGAVGTLTDKRAAIFGTETVAKETVNTLTATLGYRWQTGGRWLLRAGYTPSYVLRGETPSYSNHGFSSAFGASFGIAF